MKKTLYTTTAIALLLGSLAFSPVARAEDKPAAVAADTTANMIAVVNVQEIIKNSLAAKDIQKQLESKRDAYQKEINKQEEVLRKKDEELGKQRNILGKDVFESKVKEFKKEVEEVQRNVQEKRSKLDKAYAEALQKVEKETVGIIDQLSQEKGFRIALPLSQVLYAKKDMDISEEVLKRLNERLPKANVTLP